MLTCLHKFRTHALCCISSVLAHLLVVQAMGMLTHYDFATAVGNPAAVMVDLADKSRVRSAEAPEQQDHPAAPPEAAQPKATAQKSAQQEASGTTQQQSPAERAPEQEQAPYEERAPAEPARVASAADSKDVAEGPAAEPHQAEVQPSREVAADASKQIAVTPVATNLSAVTDFVGGNYEKLSYRISMHGLAIGAAELESKNENGITTITLRVKSSPAISSFFPVDDLIETRQISGLYVITKIKQLEGNFRSDETFTINQRTRTVQWHDLVRPRIVTSTVPSDQVMDSLSGIYYLRARDLQVGKTETLHIYDAESYAEVPVEILRREELRLANLKKVPTLVVRPLQKTAGIFRRTGDLLIWMTDDRFKVPVRIDTTMALGKVTCQLISAENGKGE